MVLTPMSKELTPAQSRVLDFIRLHMTANGYPPTRAEISKAMGYGSPNAAQEHLRAIEKKGYIELKTGISRGIRLTSMPTEQINILDVMRDSSIPTRPVLSLKT